MVLGHIGEISLRNREIVVGVLLGKQGDIGLFKEEKASKDF